MTQLNAPLSSLSHRREQWRSLGMFFVVFARQILVMQRGNVRGASGKAEELEFWVRAALVQLCRQIRIVSETRPDLSDAERRALQHMSAIAASLMALALFLADLKQRLKRADTFRCRSFSDCLLTTLSLRLPVTPPVSMSLTLPRGYFDTS